MSIEAKQNFQTYQDSDSIKYPQNEKEVSNFIKKFYKSNIPIELIGSGSKKKIGKPLQCANTLNLSKLNGIIEYLPEELYIKVKANTPIKQIEEVLKKNKLLNQLILDIYLTEKVITEQQRAKLPVIFPDRVDLKLEVSGITF